MGIWHRLEALFVANDDDNEYCTEQQVGSMAVDFFQSIRRAKIYQIAVECKQDLNCVDAATFYAKIGTWEQSIKQFVRKILNNTNQSGMNQELIVERIHFFLSMDVDDNNILFEEWIANIINDPINLCKELKDERNKKLNECIKFIAEKKLNKLSFLNVTALNVEKLKDFIATDLNIQNDSNQIVENMRLCLKIHTNSFDDKFDDSLNDAIILFANQQQNTKEKELKNDDEKEEKDENDLHYLITNKRAKNKNFVFDGKYLCEWIRASKKMFDAKKEQQSIEYIKQSISDLTVLQIADLMKERIECMPYY